VLHNRPDGSGSGCDFGCCTDDALTFGLQEGWGSEAKAT
jgi:hypothetical protein